MKPTLKKYWEANSSTERIEIVEAAFTIIEELEEKIAELMFDIWHKSNDLKNPVMVGEYIAKELNKVKKLTITDVSNNVVKLCCDCKTPLKGGFISRCPECWDEIYFPK